MFGWFSKEKKVVVNPWRTDPRISVHQALFGTPELRRALERKKGNSSDWDLQRVFDILQGGEGLYFHYECEQHDAAEYVEQLVKGLSADVSQPLRGTLLCSEGHVIEEMSPFWTLPLPFSATVEKGLQQMFDCNDTCAQGKNAALKDKKKSPPLVLVLHLKRFNLSQSKLAHVKSDCEVELTETIHTQGHSYSLCAVVDHWNSVREGHYTATIFKDGKWFQFGHYRDQVEAPIGKKSSTAVLIIYRQNEEMSEFYRTDRDQQRWTESVPYHGLMNQGSTCYLNSVLQVLFMTPEFRKALERPSNQTDRVLKRLFDKLQKGACGTESVTNDLQAPNVQRCAAEYLEILMNRVSAEVSEPFHGEFLDITLCSKGHCINEEPSKFWTLPLSMEHISLASEGFEKFFEKKKLKGIYCNKCEKTREATSRYEMTRPPQILVLLLKTFDIDPRSGYNYKSQCAVEIPGTLPTEGLMYSLCGVVDHSGGLGGGHYTATIQSQKDGHWYHFNDSHVRKVRVPNNRSSTAYLLIYRASEQVTEEKVDSGKKTSGKGRGQQNMEKTVLSTPDHGEDMMNWHDSSTGPLSYGSNVGQVGNELSTGQLGHGSNVGQEGDGSNVGQLGHGLSTEQLGHGSNVDQVGHGSNVGQMGHGSSTMQMGHEHTAAQLAHGPSVGQVDHGSSTGQMGYGLLMGQMSQRPSTGQMGQMGTSVEQVSHGLNVEQVGHGSSVAQLVQGPSVGQVGHGSSVGQLVQGPSVGQVGHGSSVGQMGHGLGIGQMGHELSATQMGHGSSVAQLVQGPSVGQVGHGSSVGQVSHGRTSGQSNAKSNRSTRRH